MNDEDIEPLEPAVWLFQLRRLATRVPAGEAGLAACLRRGYHLAQLAPRPLRHVIACDRSGEEFEALLESGQALSAIEALLGDRLGFCLRHSAIDSPTQAEVWFPACPVMARGKGRSPAAALYAAWLECLLTLDPGESAGLERAMSPIPRRSRYAPHQKPTEH